MRVIERTIRTINLSGIDDHTVRNLTIVTAGGVVRTHKGDVVLVVHQTADMTRDSKTILSCAQLENFGCTVNEKPKRVTGRTPSIVTVEGYRIPISIQDGLAYIRMRPFRDMEWDSMPHVCITSPKSWDPTKMDSTVKDEWYKNQDQELESIITSPFDQRGMLKEDPDDDGEEDSDDQHHQAVDRGSVRAFFTSLIKDELHDGYIVYEADGRLYDIDYDSDEHGEYYGRNETINCFSVRRSPRLFSKKTVDSPVGKKSKPKKKPRPRPKPTSEDKLRSTRRANASSDEEEGSVEKLGGLLSRTSPALQTDAGLASQRHFPRTIG